MRTTHLVLATGTIVFASACFPDVSAQIQQAQTAAQQAQVAAQAATQWRVDGKFTVNDAPFSATHCTSGQMMGFNGVDVLGVDGSRYRLVQEVDGSSTVIHMGIGINPVTMKGCSKITAQPSPAMVNGVRVVTGNAEVDCKAKDLHVAGNVTFQCGI